MIEYGLLWYLGMRMDANIYYFILLGFLIFIKIVQLFTHVYKAGKKNAEEECDKK